MLKQSQRKILYLPALKPLCGNRILSVLLMTQLEYWFTRHTDGFYKFLAPCEHPRYKSGDSWVEELNVTVYEFRAAFDQIGVRYKSKKQWQSVVSKGEDPFQKRFYFSTIDARSGLTLYVRNHERVNPLLLEHIGKESVEIPSDKTQVPHFSGDAKSTFPEIQKFHFPIEKYSTSGTLKSPFPIKETKMNCKDDTKTTATRSARKNSVVPFTQQTASVAAARDNVIGETLTPAQLAHLQVVVEGLQTHFPKQGAKTLAQGIQHTLCDRHAYTQAGSDFFKKLNTIQKAIRAGTWSIPVALTEQKNRVHHSQRACLQQQWRELQGEYQHLRAMMVSMREKGNPRMEQTLQQQVDRCSERLQLTEQALQDLQDTT